MSGSLRVVAIAVGLAVGVAGMGVRLYRSIPAVVVPAVPASSSVLKGVSAADAAVLRDFMRAMADVVVRDGKAERPVCKTVFDLRDRYRNALSMAFISTAVVGKYERLGQRLDEYLLAAVGDKDVPLTPELRAKAETAFLSLK